MNLVHRHILWGLTKASLAAVALFTFVLVSGNAIREILVFLLDGRMNLAMFAELLALLLPYVISYALPMGVLMGILSVLGRMCANSEYTAYRACGISLRHLATPIWIFAFAMAGVLLVINFYYAPAARATYYTTLSHSIRANPLRFLLPKTFVKEFPGYILYADEREGNTLKNFWIWELDPHNRPVKLARAKTGTLIYNEAQDSLELELKDGFSELRNSKNPDDLKTVRPTLNFDHAKVKLPLNRLLGGEEKGGLSVMTLPKLLQMEKTLAQQAKDGTPEIGRQLSALRFQIQQNFSFAFAVLALAVIGVPLGIKASRKETSANLALALGLAMGYYFLIVMTSWVSRMPQLHPEILVWLPNLIFFSVGVWLIRRHEVM